MLNNSAQDTNDSVPWLSSLPIVGYLFKSKATNQERTELMVMVTPHLVRALNPDEVPPLPIMPGKFLPSGDDIGEQLEGGGGTVDAPPAKSKSKGKQ